MINIKSIKKRLVKIILLYILVTILFSCKEELKDPPIFQLKKESPFLYKDTLVEINEEIQAGVVIKAVGDENEITTFELFKNDSLLLDTLLNKEKVFFILNLLIDSYDSTNYIFSAYDIAYNLGTYIIKTYQYDKYIYDSIMIIDSTWDTINYAVDTLIIDTVYEIDSNNYEIDTLIKIDV